MTYQRITLSTQAKVGDPGPLPEFLQGLGDSDVANLSWIGEPLKADYGDSGYLPVTDPVPHVDPVPQKLGKVEFIELVQQAGGMTDAMLVMAHNDPKLGAFWIKFQMASLVERDFPTTEQALMALVGLGYMPSGAEAVLAAWPTS